MDRGAQSAKFPEVRVQPPPQGGMEPNAARVLPAQDDHLVSEGDKLELQRRSAAKTGREQRNESGQNGDHAARPYGDRVAIRAAITLPILRVNCLV
jgi:hypothetical protein